MCARSKKSRKTGELSRARPKQLKATESPIVQGVSRRCAPAVVPLTDTEIIDLLANLDITQWGHADESAKQKAQDGQQERTKKERTS